MEPVPIKINPQFRTFDRLYVFKEKGDGNLVVKVMDVTQRVLTKVQCKLALFELTQEQFRSTPLLNLIVTLVNKEQLSKEYLPVEVETSTAAMCTTEVAQILQQFKPKVVVEPREIQDFTCPLTLEIFQEPVIDEHGHTFEKNAIETHLRANTLCPLNRAPIKSLTPNLAVKALIEKYKQKEPIPCFSLFKESNDKLAVSNIANAQACAEAKAYEDALEAYARALKYRKDWRDYQEIPRLYQLMEEGEKATLAYLYLAQYQLEAGKISAAIHTLEACQKGKVPCRPVDLLLVKLYELNNETSKALEQAKITAMALTKDHKEEATALYKRTLTRHAEEFGLYVPLSELLGEERRPHLLLKGMCHALTAKDLRAAGGLLSATQLQAHSSFYDRCVELMLLNEEKRTFDVRERLMGIAAEYNAKEMRKDAARAYKLLDQIERRPEYCEKLVAVYKGNVEKQTRWYRLWVELLIQRSEWTATEKVAEEALLRVKEADKVLLYENLETVYTHWEGNKLEHLLPKLGRAYVDHKRFSDAEKTFRKVYERFSHLEDAIALAAAMEKQGKTRPSVQIYYEATALALMDGKFDRLDHCVRQIRAMDPQMRELDAHQRMHLLTQHTILDLTSRLHVVELERVCFRASHWNKHFGDVGQEPPLPGNIAEILKAPCPFWPGKRVQETHMLVLIPKTVNGKALTLDYLEELIQKPKEGPATKYRVYWDKLKAEFGKQSPGASYWVLMTRDVLEGTRSKSYTDQCALAAPHGAYGVPTLLEAATSMLMHHVRSGERLYSDSPYTYTRCQEKVTGSSWQCVVGGIAGAGLFISGGSPDDAGTGVGLAVARKF